MPLIRSMLLKKEYRLFFLNSFHLKDEKIKKNINLPNLTKKLEPFQKIKDNFEATFFDLINPKVSYDF